MNIRPIGERVVIKPMQNEKGERVPLEVKVGDVVVFAKFIGTNVKQDGVDYLIVNGERDILCVIE